MATVVCPKCGLRVNADEGVCFACGTRLNKNGEDVQENQDSLNSKGSNKEIYSNYSNQSIQQTEKLIKQVEDAARKGAKEGAKGSLSIRFISLGVMIAVCVLIAVVLYRYTHSLTHKWDDFLQTAKEQLDFGKAREEYDLVVEDDGVLGFTAADFAEAMLGDSSQLKKIEVFTQEVADVVTITDAGLANIKVFEKTQVITYHGTATYTVDLSRLDKKDISMDEDRKIVTMYIPHCSMEKINIPEDQMEFGDVSKGLLAFGEIKLTPEQHAQIQSAARAKMEDKLKETNALEQADRFAKMSVWEMYQVMVSKVSPEYTLEIEFK